MTTTTATIIGAIIGAIVSAAASIVVCIINNNKQSALMLYRLEQLEKKVDKHNHLVERMYAAEKQISILEESVKDLKTE